MLLRWIVATYRKTLSIKRGDTTSEMLTAISHGRNICRQCFGEFHLSEISVADFIRA